MGDFTFDVPTSVNLLVVSSENVIAWNLQNVMVLDLKEAYLGKFGFQSSLLFFLKQLVRNRPIGIFAQKSKVFIGPLIPLHSKDHAPSPCA